MGIWKCVMLKDTPMSRNGLSKMVVKLKMVPLSDTPKCRNWLSKMWFGVVPSVPDGDRNLSRRAKALHRKTFCTQVSGMSKMLFENLKL